MSNQKEVALEKFKVNAIDVLRTIPDDLLSQLAEQTKVNYCAKVLTGERMFYLLTYAFIRSDRTSQRKLEDYFKHPAFQALFNIEPGSTVRHSSISARLKNINVTFFEKAHEIIYDKLSSMYSEDELLKRNIMRLDSSMVAETCNKLFKGISTGTNKDIPEKHQIKYTAGFDGFAIKQCEIFFAQEDSSEDVAMPKVLMPLIEKDKDRTYMYVIDRGLSSLGNYKKIEGSRAEFVGRLKLNRKMALVRLLSDENTDRDLGKLELLEDKIVNFYDHTKGGKRDETEFRVIRAKFKEYHVSSHKKEKKNDQEICLVTNNFTLSAKEIFEIYKRRWDIEVFFYGKRYVMGSHSECNAENQQLKVRLPLSASHNNINDSVL